MKKIKEVMEVTGYLSGSQMRDKDSENHEHDEDFFIDSMLNKLIECGGKPIYETYRIFKVNERVYGTILVDFTEIDQDAGDVPILNLEGD